jgi:glutathione S-transferase
MENLTLYSGPLSMFGAKVQIALLEKDIAAEVVMVPFEMKALYEPKHPDVLRINPKRQVPVLIHGDLEIFDSTQIFEYLEDLKPDRPLWPRDIVARARARRWELEADEVYFPHVIRLMGLQEHMEDPAAVTACSGCAGFYARLDQHMSDGRPWLAGDDYSYADIAVFMAQVFGARMQAPMTEMHPHLLAWRDRMMQRRPVQQVAGAMARWLLGIGRPLPDFMKSLAAA